MSNFKVDILTPSKTLVKDLEADSLLIPTVKGQINLLKEHTHIVSKLETGVVTVKSKEGSDSYLVTTGICKVLKDKVTILSDVAEHQAEIDKDRAQKALDRAIAKLNGKEALHEAEHRKFVRKKERAEARLKAAYLR